MMHTHIWYICRQNAHKFNDEWKLNFRKIKQLGKCCRKIIFFSHNFKNLFAYNESVFFLLSFILSLSLCVWEMKKKKESLSRKCKFYRNKIDLKLVASTRHLTICNFRLSVWFVCKSIERNMQARVIHTMARL